MDNKHQINAVYYNQFIVNKISFIPLWRSVNGVFKDLIHIKDNHYLLNDTKFDEEFELDKIDDIKNNKNAICLFMGGEILAFFSLIALFIFGFITNPRLSFEALFAFILLNGISFLFYIRKFYKIFNIASVLNFCIFVFLLAKYGGNGELYNSLVFYCALGYGLYFILPTIIFKYNAVFLDGSASFFSLSRKKGILLVAYLDDEMDKDTIKTLRERDERKKRKNKQEKNMMMRTTKNV